MKKIRIFLISSMLLLLASHSHPANIYHYSLNRYSVKIVYSKLTDGETLSSLIKRHKGMDGINGGFIGKEGAAPTDLLICEGRKIQKRTDKAKRATFWLGLNGTAYIDRYDHQRIRSGLAAGPLLVFDGVKADLHRDEERFGRGFLYSNTSRNIIALKGRELLLIKNFRGSLYQAQERLMKIGVDSAMNLDGGSQSSPSAKIRSAILTIK